MNLLTIFIVTAISHVLFGVLTTKHRFNKIVTYTIYGLYGIGFVLFCMTSVPNWMKFIFTYIVHFILYCILSKDNWKKIIFLASTYSVIVCIFFGILLAVQAFLSNIHLFFRISIFIASVAIIQVILYLVILPRIKKVSDKIFEAWDKLAIGNLLFLMLIFMQVIFPFQFTKEEPLRFLIFFLSALVYIYTFIIIFSNITLESVKIEAEEQCDKLKEMVHHDALTNLYNRASYDEYETYLIEKNNNEVKDKTAIVVFDIDKFKRINDTFGHAEGDNVIKKVAEIIDFKFENQLAKTFRFGGDEFVVICESIEKEDLKAILKDLANELLNRNKISISYGYSFVNYNIYDPISTAFKKADKNMYSSKASKE